VPRLVGRERIGDANVLQELSTRAMGMVGPAVGGTLAAAAGLAPVVLLDSASFLASAALLALVPELLAGQKLADAEVIVASLDLAMAEADG